MVRFASLSVLGVLLAVAGCDGDSDSSGSTAGWSTDTGSGTGSLLVDAHVEGESWDSTHFEVEVRLEGQLVSGATVEVESELGAVTLAEHEPGFYRGNQDGFAPAYRLRIDSGEHDLEATLESPEPHQIQSPAPGSSYDAAAGDLQVVWSPTGAHETRVETDEAEFEFDGDPGQAEIPSGAFESDEDEVRVERSNEIALAGGAAGSDFEVSFSDRSEFDVANPND